MSARDLAIVGAGMVCGVGLSAPAACAAIRCGISNFQETRFMDAGGEWIMGSGVPLEQPWRGTAKLTRMLASVLRECAAGSPSLEIGKVPVLICLAEADRPGRLAELEKTIANEIQKVFQTSFHKDSDIIAEGRVAVATALQQARTLIYDQGHPQVIIAGTDSLLVGPSLASYAELERLLTSDNSNGFIPGEAAAAVVVSRPGTGGAPQLVCGGIGTGLEQATVAAEEIPLRADGLVAAVRGALGEAGCEMGDLDFRIADVSGEQYGFKEAALVVLRLLRRRKQMFDFWHPADCIGEVGAASGPAILSVLLAGMRKGYCPGLRTVAHLGNDDGRRAAMILAFHNPGRT